MTLKSTSAKKVRYFCKLSEWDMNGLNLLQLLLGARGWPFRPIKSLPRGNFPEAIFYSIGENSD